MILHFDSQKGVRSKQYAQFIEGDTIAVYFDNEKVSEFIYKRRLDRYSQ
ncbi:hypothetical protein ACTJIJ_14665 [Niabella sp. 22666]